jgi:hypothetical protein
LTQFSRDMPPKPSSGERLGIKASASGKRGTRVFNDPQPDGVRISVHV